MIKPILSLLYPKSALSTQLFYAVLALVLLVLEAVYVRYARKTSASAVAHARNINLPLVATSGGFVVCVAVTAFTLYYYLQGLTADWRLLAGCMLLSLVSLIDDHRPLSPMLRLAIQMVVVSWTFDALMRAETLHIFMLLLILGTGMINAYNFMDGINGMLVLYSLVLLGSLYVLLGDCAGGMMLMSVVQARGTLLVLMIAVGVLGVFNLRTRALVFAGDVGSIAIGYCIMVIMASLILSFGNASCLVFVAVYAVDTVYTIFQRLFEGESIITPHRKHLYQILLRRGRPQLMISGCYAGAQLLINIVYFLLPVYLHWAYAITVLTLLTTVYFICKRRLSCSLVGKDEKIA